MIPLSQWRVNHFQQKIWNFENSLKEPTKAGMKPVFQRNDGHANEPQMEAYSPEFEGIRAALKVTGLDQHLARRR